VLEATTSYLGRSSSQAGTALGGERRTPRSSITAASRAGRRGTFTGRTGVPRRPLRAASPGFTGQTVGITGSPVLSNCARIDSAGARRAGNALTRALPLVLPCGPEARLAAGSRGAAGGQSADSPRRHGAGRPRAYTEVPITPIQSSARTGCGSRGRRPGMGGRRPLGAPRRVAAEVVPRPDARSLVLFPML
jgi:hypothetical protein